MDEDTRQYRISSRERNPYAPIPGIDFFNHAERDMMLLVRLRRYSRKKMRSLLGNSSRRKELLFPQVGEILTLTESTSLASLRGLRSEDEARKAHVKVKALYPRSQHSSTAAVLVSM